MMQRTANENAAGLRRICYLLCCLEEQVNHVVTQPGPPGPVHMYPDIFLILNFCFLSDAASVHTHQTNS